MAELLLPQARVLPSSSAVVSRTASMGQRRRRAGISRRLKKRPPASQAIGFTAIDPRVWAVVLMVRVDEPLPPLVRLTGDGATEQVGISLALVGWLVMAQVRPTEPENAAMDVSARLVLPGAPCVAMVMAPPLVRVKDGTAMVTVTPMVAV